MVVKFFLSLAFDVRKQSKADMAYRSRAHRHPAHPPPPRARLSPHTAHTVWIWLPLKVALDCQWRMAAFSPLSCPRGSQRTNEHRTFEDIKVGCALRPSRRLSSVAARRASPLDSALRVDLETTLGHRQLHPDVSHMRRVSPPRVSLYSMLGCELKKAHSAPAASSSTHAVLVPLGWPEDDSQCKIGKTSRGAV